MIDVLVMFAAAFVVVAMFQKSWRIGVVCFGVAASIIIGTALCMHAGVIR